MFSVYYHNTLITSPARPWPVLYHVEQNLQCSQSDQDSTRGYVKLHNNQTLGLPPTAKQIPQITVLFPEPFTPIIKFRLRPAVSVAFSYVLENRINSLTK